MFERAEKHRRQARTREQSHQAIGAMARKRKIVRSRSIHAGITVNLYGRGRAEPRHARQHARLFAWLQFGGVETERISIHRSSRRKVWDFASRGGDRISDIAAAGWT